MLPTEYIGFSGHRDCLTLLKELDQIAQDHPLAIWVHGDAKDGFDAQVKAYARLHGIQEIGIPPKYRFYPDREAPIIRNRKIVAMVSRIFLCYDKVRLDGGTYSCIGFAKELYVPVSYVECIKVGRKNYGRMPERILNG